MGRVQRGGGEISGGGWSRGEAGGRPPYPLKK
jgi:hypothetical protein